jgi:hypothetical protein
VCAQSAESVTSLKSSTTAKLKKKIALSAGRGKAANTERPLSKSEDIIESLNRGIKKLLQERRDRQNKPDDNKEGLTLPVYCRRMDMGIPGTMDLPTRHRLKDSDNKVILEGSISLKASLP